MMTFFIAVVSWSRVRDAWKRLCSAIDPPSTFDLYSPVSLTFFSKSSFSPLKIKYNINIVLVT